jgi:cation diffusion facilitator family transporter
MTDRNSLIKTASVISVAGNAVLAAAKIVTGIAAGSAAVLGDGFDSSTDIFISLITLVISVMIARPPDKEHPYGHFRAETIATAVLSFIIFFIGGMLALTTLEKLTSHTEFVLPGILAVVVTAVSIAGKALLALNQYRLGRKAGSPLIIANAKNMLNDIITSATVLAGLVCVFLFNLPVVDKILAIVVGIWIMFTAVRIFKGTVTEMMEGEVNMDLYNRIFDIVKKTEGVGNPHRARIRKVGFHRIIDMDVEVPGSLTVTEAHDRVMGLENEIRTAVPNVYDVIIHIEPEGNVERHERWGLQEKHLEK